MKRPRLLMSLVAALLLVIVVGIAAGRLSPKTLAVLAGAVSGLLVAIPTGIVISHVTRHRATTYQDRLAWYKAQAELSELRAHRLETLALHLPAHRHELVVHAHLDRQIATALNEGDLDEALELTKAAPDLPEGMIASQTDLVFALPTSTWPGDVQ